MAHLRALLLIVPFSLLIIFCGVNTRQLQESSEGRVACVAQEMLEGGDWIVPHLNGEIRKEKPALSSWCVALTTKVFGEQDVQAVHAFIPSGLAALGLIMLAYAWSALLSGSAGTGTVKASSFSLLAMLAAIILAASPGFLLQSRSAELDMLLALFVALTYWGFYTFRTCGCHRALWIGYAALALGILTKAHVALVLTVPALVLWHYVERHRGSLPYSSTAKSSTRIAHGLGILLLLVLIVPCAVVFIQQSGITWADFNKEGGTARFDNAKTGHLEAWYWYFYSIPGWFLPWILFLPWSLWVNYKQPPDARSPFRRLCWLWFGVNFFIFSLIAAKQRHYAIPFFFPLAILIADGLERCLTHPLEKWRNLTRYILAGIFFLLSVAAIVLAMPGVEIAALASDELLRQITQMMAALTGLFFLTVAVCWARKKETGSQRFMWWWAGVLGVVLIRMLNLESGVKSDEVGPQRFCEEVRRIVTAGAELYDYDVVLVHKTYRAQALFYLHHRVSVSEMSLAELVNNTTHPLYILANEKQLATIPEDGYTVLAHKDRFLGHKPDAAYSVSLIRLNKTAWQGVKRK